MTLLSLFYIYIYIYIYPRGELFVYAEERRLHRLNVRCLQKLISTCTICLHIHCCTLLLSWSWKMIGLKLRALLPLLLESVFPQMLSLSSLFDMHYMFAHSLVYFAIIMALEDDWLEVACTISFVARVNFSRDAKPKFSLRHALYVCTSTCVLCYYYGLGR